MRIEIYTDGAARGNPGESASGYSIYSGDRLIGEDVWYNGRRTNNFAEYTAVINALKWCLGNVDAGTADVTVHSDSQLVVNQMNGSYKVKSTDMRGLNSELKRLCGGFRRVSFRSVPRSDGLIAKVDRRLNAFLDSREV